MGVAGEVLDVKECGVRIFGRPASRNRRFSRSRMSCGERVRGTRRVRFRLSRGRRRGEFLGLVREPARRQVVGEPAVQVDAHGNLPALAALLAETEGPVVAVVAETPAEWAAFTARSFAGDADRERLLSELIGATLAGDLSRRCQRIALLQEITGRKERVEGLRAEARRECAKMEELFAELDVLGRQIAAAHTDYWEKRWAEDDARREEEYRESELANIRRSVEESSLPRQLEAVVARIVSAQEDAAGMIEAATRQD